ncbi:MAG TPA: DUF488 family protein [Nocardioides sp.]
MSAGREHNLLRIYDEPDGGYRVLVDRLWPRGVSKAEASLDEWLKDVAPSTELRRWYGHDVARFDEFAHRYRAELQLPPASDAVRHLIELAQAGTLTLLTATRDVEHSAARVLQGALIEA